MAILCGSYMDTIVLGIHAAWRIIQSLVAWNFLGKIPATSRQSHIFPPNLPEAFTPAIIFLKIDIVLHSRYLFFLDINNVTQSLKICVKKCPDRVLSKMEDICKFYKDTGSQLCHDRPGADFSACNSDSSIFKNGSCPERPVYPSTPVLNRCIPRAVKEVSETIVSNLYGLINSWDVIEQVLGDICKTWRQILALSFVACGKNLAYYWTITYIYTSCM